MTARLALIALAALMLAACGRAGDPYRPSEAARIEAKENKQPLPPKPTLNRKNPDKRFLLDPLIL